MLSLAGAPARQIKGKTLLGMHGLPRPEALADNEGTPVFSNAMYRNDEVRMVALWRDLHYEGMHRPVIILEGESIDISLRTHQQVWRQGLCRDGRMLLLAVLTVWFEVRWALHPLLT